MHRISPSSPIAVAVLAAALLGGGVALAGAAAFGDLGSKTVVREIVQPVPGEPASFATKSARMTINQIYSRSAPGVVQITATSVQRVAPDPFFGNPFGLPQKQTQQALGSGFVLDKAGHIITNYHVVQGATRVEVSFSNDEQVNAHVIGSDPSTDIAVLQVDAHSRALTPLTLGDSDSVNVGDSVVAIGNPFGLDRSITAGIVSALQRPIQAPNGYTIDHVIQTDAALNHGNSGGPLLNAQDQVIGVNAQIQTGGTSDGNVGIGFAIPINTVRTVVSQLIAHGKVEHPFLGISAQPIQPDIAQLFHLPVKAGLLVQSVTPGSGAAKAGLHAATNRVTVSGETWPLGGDIIVSIDGVPTTSIERLRDAVAAKQPGDTITLGILRNSKHKTMTVRLGRQPTSPSS
jgi:S1-C subfamily serine protease